LFFIAKKQRRRRLYYGQAKRARHARKAGDGRGHAGEASADNTDAQPPAPHLVPVLVESIAIIKL
jgi:hypothetical protein